MMEFVRTGALPELDGNLRPKLAYDRVIHEHDPRPPHFDSGRLAQQFGDDGHLVKPCQNPRIQNRIHITFSRYPR